MIKEIYSKEYLKKEYRIVANYESKEKDQMFIFEHSTGKDALGDNNWASIPFVKFILPSGGTINYDRIAEIMAVIKDAQWKWASLKDAVHEEEE